MTGRTERLKTAIADRDVIERELGQGGMATVYLAHDVEHNVLVQRTACSVQRGSSAEPRTSYRTKMR